MNAQEPLFGRQGFIDDANVRNYLEGMGMLPYIDPVTMKAGIERDDTIVVRGRVVSAYALLKYLLAHNDTAREGLVRLWDGLPLTVAELNQLLDHLQQRMGGVPPLPEEDEDDDTVFAGARTRLQSKIAHNIREMNAGELRGGKGKHPMVRSRRQAIAIAYAQTGQSRRKKGGHRRR